MLFTLQIVLDSEIDCLQDCLLEIINNSFTDQLNLCFG